MLSGPWRPLPSAALHLLTHLRRHLIQRHVADALRSRHVALLPWWWQQVLRRVNTRILSSRSERSIKAFTGMTRLLRTLLSLAALAVVVGGCAQQTRLHASRAPRSRRRAGTSRSPTRRTGRRSSAPRASPRAARSAGRSSSPTPDGCRASSASSRPTSATGRAATAACSRRRSSSPCRTSRTQPTRSRCSPGASASCTSAGSGRSPRARCAATASPRRCPTAAPRRASATGDNAYIGSALTVRYTWRASAAEPAPPAVLAAAPHVSYRVVLKRLLKRGRLDFVARCNRPCRLVGWAKLPKRPRAKKASLTRRRAVTIPRGEQARADQDQADEAQPARGGPARPAQGQGHAAHLPHG